MERILLLNTSHASNRIFRQLLAKTDFAALIENKSMEPMEVIATEKPDIVVMEIGEEPVEDIATLQSIRKLKPQTPLIAISANTSPEITMEVMKHGAYDIMHMPIDTNQAHFLIHDALATVRSIKSLRAGINPVADFAPEEIIGNTSPMQAIFKLIGQVAPSNATVLIQGESGVGKELIARALYRHSLRQGRPYMAVNCAAIPETLLESELFGHEKGAFTGATQMRKGKFEYCDEGTIFMDEVGDLPLGTQAKLLRVLQDGEFTRLGSNIPIRVNVRVIAATNKDLEKEIADKQFREDLFYRLNVVRIEVPTLRERKADIPALCLAILKKLAVKENITVTSFSNETMQILENYSWPGNVRELENCIHRAAVLATGDTILPHHLPQSLFGTSPSKRGQENESELVSQAFDTLIRHAQKTPVLPLLDFVEQELLLRILRETHGNQLKASKRLGMARATLRKRIDQLGIMDDFK